MIYIASDHGGFELKECIKEYLESKNISVVDMGPKNLVENDDYPDYVVPLVNKVLEEPNTNKGILLCRSGVGVSMFANKFKGIRCALSWAPYHAESSRKDDDTNVLALPADYIDETIANEIVDAWIETEFSNDERHVRRLEKIENVEKMFKEVS